ncbi:periplasmic binding protein-like I [Backusella circina FSU 941]|nr:periplasmic binding protein-like I [Backusella circina FSU 941]
MLKNNRNFNKTAVVFGRTILTDEYNTISHVDNGTVIIKPTFNTSGLTELKVGILLPFSQKNDKLTAEIVWGGSSAIRMAANAINQKGMIPGAYITLVHKDSFPNEQAGDQGAVTEAVYASVTLLQQGVIGVIGDVSSSWTSLSALMTSNLEIPQCSFTATSIGFSDKTQYKYFFRTIPTKVTLADVMLDFAVSQRWGQIGIIYSNDPLGQQFYQRVMAQATYKKLTVTGTQVLMPGANTDEITDVLDFVSNSSMRVLLIGITGSDQISLIMQAAKMNLLTPEYAWLLMDDNTNTLYRAVEKNNNETQDLINFNNTFNGIFFFDTKLSLDGYPPFEAFLDEWSQLDPRSFPNAGRRNVSTNEGPAYSCMMTMARGFNKTISTMPNQTLALEKLSNRSLGSSMTPLTFDTGYLSPEGPLHYDSNGDLTTGNHRIFNLQYGNRVSIGSSIAGNLELTQLPMFHDGTFQPPADSPPSVSVNPDYTNPVAQVILSFAITVIIYRKHDVFRASSPLFCCLELVGFVFTYGSVISMLGIPTKAVCFISPITFNLGFLLVLGIFNNIFISRKVITDSQLMKTTSVVVSIDMIILVIGLMVCQPQPELIRLTYNTHYWSCVPEKSGSTYFFLLFTSIYAACMLAFATFLAYKTRSAGRHYDHYNECRQMGLSVYNILFSALVGFTAAVNPIANFHTKFYMVTIATLWATTFSLFALFIPKLLLFYKQWKTGKTASRKNSENPEESDRTGDYSFLKSTDQPTVSGEPSSSRTYDDNNVYVEVQEEEQKEGTMFSYHHASVHSSQPEGYVLKIHGQGLYDVYLQVADFTIMESWQACINQDIMKHHTSTQTITAADAAAAFSSSPKLSDDGESIISLPQRRRSKSQPSLLNSESTFSQYPLLSASSSSSSSLSRKRRKTTQMEL